MAALVHIVHDNAKWMAPLREAFAKARVLFEEFDLTTGAAYDLSPKPHQGGVWFVRVSPSSHTRGARFSMEAAEVLVAQLEAAGANVVNGSSALTLEMSKTRQGFLLQAEGLPSPRTVAVVGKEQLEFALRGWKHGDPFLLKHSRGGSGSGVRLFRDVSSALTYVKSLEFEEPIDGTTLIQEYIASPQECVYRLEFVDGQYMYAVKVDTGAFIRSNGRSWEPEDEPADSPQHQKGSPSNIAPSNNNPLDDVPSKFTVLPDFTHPIIPKLEKLLSSAHVDVCGIEIVVDHTGEAFVIDMNCCNTNYNLRAEEAAGMRGHGCDTVVAFLARRASSVRDVQLDATANVRLKEHTAPQAAIPDRQAIAMWRCCACGRTWRADAQAAQQCCMFAPCVMCFEPDASENQRVSKLLEQLDDDSLTAMAVVAASETDGSQGKLRLGSRGELKQSSFSFGSLARPTPVHVVHDNAKWMVPLREAFTKAEVPFEELDLSTGAAYDLGQQHQGAVWFVRVSPSSHTRGARFSMEAAEVLVAQLEAAGASVVNGSSALTLEMSKTRQGFLLQAAGIPSPRTVAVVGRAHLETALHEWKHGDPLLLKHSRGGSGSGVRLFRDVGSALIYVNSLEFEEPIDGITLIQQYIASPEECVYRLEFVDGQCMYAVKVNTGAFIRSNGRSWEPEDEPADLPFGAGPSGTVPAPSNNNPLDDVPSKFTVLPDFTHPIVAKLEKLLSSAHVDVCGIEIVVDHSGEAFVIDMNCCNTNYNLRAEEVAGMRGHGCDAVVAFLARRASSVRDVEDTANVGLQEYKKEYLAPQVVSAKKQAVAMWRCCACGRRWQAGPNVAQTCCLFAPTVMCFEHEASASRPHSSIQDSGEYPAKPVCQSPRYKGDTSKPVIGGKWYDGTKDAEGAVDDATAAKRREQAQAEEQAAREAEELAAREAEPVSWKGEQRRLAEQEASMLAAPEVAASTKQKTPMMVDIYDDDDDDDDDSQRAMPVTIDAIVRSFPIAPAGGDLRRFLSGLGLSSLQPIFDEQHIDLECLEEMTPFELNRDLAELRLSIGIRHKIAKGLKARAGTTKKAAESAMPNDEVMSAARHQVHDESRLQKQHEEIKQLKHIAERHGPTRAELPIQSGQEELRIDPSDGQAYPKWSFLQEYGGTFEWDCAQAVTPAEHGSGPQPSASSQALGCP